MPQSSNRKDDRTIVAQNRKARHDYAILDTVEAGLVLTGTEVKSLRLGRASLVDGFAQIRDGEAFQVVVSQRFEATTPRAAPASC